MKKCIIGFAVIALVAGFVLYNSSSNRACAGSKCHYRMVCGGNSSIKATVCATDCNDSATKEKAKRWFKSKCSSASTPGNSYSGWSSCDVTL